MSCSCHLLVDVVDSGFIANYDSDRRYHIRFTLSHATDGRSRRESTGRFPWAVEDMAADAPVLDGVDLVEIHLGRRDPA
jgi:hypothetical protein